MPGMIIEGVIAGATEAVTIETVKYIIERAGKRIEICNKEL